MSREEIFTSTFGLKFKKMKKIIWIILIILTAGCEKNDERSVIYRISNSPSGFTVRYLNDSQELVTEKIVTQSAQDVWEYSFISEDGGIVFVSANYKDPAGALKVQVMVDQKLFRQASSKNDTISFVTLSGVVPIRE